MEIQKSELKSAIIASTGINPSAENIPSTLSKVIVPIIDVTPQKVTVSEMVKAVNSTTTGASTVFTTPSDRDFFLTGAAISMATDATADNTNVFLNCVIGGATVQILRLNKITTTAFNGSMVKQFTNPIKLDKNTAITVSTSFTAGAAAFWGSIEGFTLSKF
jgi:hypothetical protein